MMYFWSYSRLSSLSKTRMNLEIVQWNPKWEPAMCMHSVPRHSLFPTHPEITDIHPAVQVNPQTALTTHHHTATHSSQLSPNSGNQYIPIGYPMCLVVLRPLKTHWVNILRFLSRNTALKSLFYCGSSGESNIKIGGKCWSQ